MGRGSLQGRSPPLTLQGASRAIEFACRDEIETLAHAVSWLTYVPTISRPWDEPAWRGETGRVEDVIRAYASQWSLDGRDTTAHLAGIRR
jgi:ferredoxin--NADP+ reductase